MASPDAFIVVAPIDNQFVAGAKTYDMVFHTEGSEQSFVFGHSNMYMKIDSNGYVGIGVANPVSRLQVAGDILPAGNLTYDLGSSNLRFRDLYLSGSTIDLGGVELSKSNLGLTIGDSNQQALFYFQDPNSFVIDTSTDANIVFGKTLAASNIELAGGLFRNGNIILPGDAPLTVDDSDDLEINTSSNVSILKNDKLGQAIWGVSLDSTGHEFGTHTVSDNQGNVYLIGDYNNSSTPIIYNAGKIPSPIQLRSSTNYAVFIIKFNSNGIAQWAASLDSNDSDYSYGLDADKDGNVFISGTYRGNFVVYDQDQNPSPTVTMTTTANRSIFLVKYNTLGIAQWGTTIDSSANANSYSICVDKDNSVYLSVSRAGNGVINNANGTSSGLSFTATPGYESSIVIKYDRNGFAQWVVNITRVVASTIYGIKVDDLNNLYVAFAGQNYYDSNPPIILNSNGNPSLVNIYVRSSSLIKFNSNGIAQWASILYNSSGTSYQNFKSIAVDKVGNIFVSGDYFAPHGHQLRNADGSLSPISFPGSWDSQTFLIKFNNNGIAIWSTLIACNNENVYGESCLVNQNEQIYLCGKISYYNSTVAIYDSDNTLSSVTIQGVTNYVATFVAAFDKDGHAEWASSLTGTDNYTFVSSSIDSNGDIYVSGGFWSTPFIFNGDSQLSLVEFQPASPAAAFLIKFSHFPVYSMTSSSVSDGAYKYFINASENTATVQILDATSSNHTLSKIYPYSSLQLIAYDSVWYDMSVKSLGYKNTSNVDVGVYVDNHVLPSANETYDLGSSNLRFRDLYLSGSTIDLGGVLMQKDVGGLRIVNQASSSNETIIVDKIVLSSSQTNQITLSVGDSNNLSLVTVSNNIVTSNAVGVNMIKSFAHISKTADVLNGYGVQSVGLSLTNTGQIGASAGTFTVDISPALLFTSNYALMVTPESYENGSNISYRVFNKSSSNFKVQLYSPDDGKENPANWSFSILKN